MCYSGPKNEMMFHFVKTLYSQIGTDPNAMPVANLCHHKYSNTITVTYHKQVI